MQIINIMQNLKGKTALVTGGGRGLGKAVALALAAEGVNVAITGRNENNLKSVAAEIESKGVKSSYSKNYKMISGSLIFLSIMLE